MKKETFKAPKWFIELMDSRGEVCKKVLTAKGHPRVADMVWDGGNNTKATKEQVAQWRDYVETLSQKEYKLLISWLNFLGSYADGMKAYAFRRFIYENIEKFSGSPPIQMDYLPETKELRFKSATSVIDELAVRAGRTISQSIKEAMELD